MRQRADQCVEATEDEEDYNKSVNSRAQLSEEQE